MGKLLKLLRNSVLSMILLFILFLSAVLLFKSSYSDSAIAPEPANIASGYGYIRYFDSRLDPAQPPISKAISAFPLLFQRPNFPATSLNWQRDINGVIDVGRQFLYESNNNAFRLINSARLFSIIISLILLIAVYLWSKNLIGKWWALFPTFLLAFCPIFLANGHYATSSLFTTLAIFASLFAFLDFLNHPARKKLFIAGGALGLALLTNFASLILIPCFGLILSCFYLNNTHRDWATTESNVRMHRFGKRAARYLESFLVILLIAFLLVALIYIIFTLGYPQIKQQSDTQFLLNSFEPKWLANPVIQLSGIPVIRGVAQYFLGILMNVPTSIGIFNKIPAALLLKTPLPIILLILISIFTALSNILKSAWNIIRRRSNNFSDYLSTNFSEFSMMILLALYWPVTMIFFSSSGASGLLPTFPLVFILTASGIKRWVSGTELEKSKNLMFKIFLVYEEFFQISVKSAVVSILIILYLTASLISYPNFLSYSNLLAGGDNSAHQYLSGADYDLGQDLARLKSWIDLNLPDGNKIAVDYYGGGDLKTSLGEIAQEWDSSKGNPNNDGISWLAVSATKLASSKLATNAEDQYLWLTAKPFTRAGTTIFIYKLE